MAGSRKRPQNKRRKKNKAKKIIFTMLFISLLVLAVLSVTVFFPLGYIDVQGKSIYSAEQIIKASGIEVEDNMFMPLFNGSKKRITRSLPYIKSVDYKYSLPDSMTIVVTPYLAAYQFKVKKDFVIAAKDGTVLEVVSNEREGLPIINVNALEYKVRDTLKFGDAAREEIFAELSASLSNFEYTFNAMDLTDTLNINLLVNDKITVNLGSSIHLTKKMNMIKKMLANIPEGESGTINVSAWTPESKQASYVKNETE